MVDTRMAGSLHRWLLLVTVGWRRCSQVGGQTENVSVCGKQTDKIDNRLYSPVFVHATYLLLEFQTSPDKVLTSTARNVHKVIKKPRRYFFHTKPNMSP